MSASEKEQVYYEFLARTDHPVFKRDYSQSQNITSPLNSIFNRVFAKQHVRLRAVLDEMYLNLFPNTVTALMIDDWEIEFFGFKKPGLPIDQRVQELVIKFNKRFHMNVQDAVELGIAVTGLTPQIVRNLTQGGWSLGNASLGVTTIFRDPVHSVGAYAVAFTKPVDSTSLKQLDSQLTIIEKAGSRHILLAPPPAWILGKSALGIDTNLGV
jgi:hypothetical protein